MFAWIPAALVAIGLAAIFLELFVPSFGIIGVAGFGCVVAAVVLAYVHLGGTVGTVFLTIVLVCTPT
jgi:membrane-bound ClpP family serine protease